LGVIPLLKLSGANCPRPLEHLVSADIDYYVGALNSPG
jgi:hypothetical protein